MKTKLAPDIYEILFRNRTFGIAWVGVVALHLGLVAAGLPSIDCPFHTVTKLPCPGCGLSRGMVLLLGGDWVGMLRAHPMAPYFLALGAIVGVAAFLPTGQRRLLAELAVSVEQRTHVNAAMLTLFVLYGAVRLVLHVATA